MKQLSQALDIGPKYSADFERAGVRTLSELARVENFQELSLRTEIPVELVREWHEKAKERVKASRYRLAVALIITVVALGLLGWLLSVYRESPARVTAQADAFYEAGDFERALQRYDKVVQLYPKYEPAYANKGATLRRLGRTDAALAALNKALELDAEDMWAYSERGNVYSDRGDYERAIQDYDKAIRLDSNHEFAYANKGFALHRLGRYEDALGALNRALELDPKDAWAYAERGIVYSDRGEYERAIQDYDEAIRLDSKYKFAYANKGFALGKLGRYEDALSALNKTLELDPKDKWAYGERASIYHDGLHQYEAAYLDLRRGSELGPSEIADEADLAEAALTSGRFQEAFNLASKILADNESKDMGEFNVCERMSMRFIAVSALLLQGRTAEAKTRLEEFVSYYRSASRDYKRCWNYSGTLYFIESHRMDGLSKNLILGLIRLLDGSPGSTIGQIERSASTLK